MQQRPMGRGMEEREMPGIEMCQLRPLLAGMLEDTVSTYLSDLAYVPEAQLSASPGGVARAPLDYTLECAMFARKVAASLRGDKAPDVPEEEWEATWRAQTLESALAEVRAAADDLIATWNELPTGELTKPIPGFFGEHPAHVMVFYVISHFNYHDGQVNYVQALNGDGAMHWSG